MEDDCVRLLQESPTTFLVSVTSRLLGLLMIGIILTGCAANGSVLFKQALELHADGNDEQAIVQLNRAIGIDPELAGAWYLRGNMNLQLGRIEHASRAQRQSVIRITDNYISPF